MNAMDSSQSSPLDGVIRPLDVSALTQQYQNSKPFPFVLIDDFLEPEFADLIASSYPTFDDANQSGMGHTFNLLNEKKKIQITDNSKFPEPVARLNNAISSPEFLAHVSAFTGISNLLADTTLSGAGMHITGPRGRLDVHVDFNYLETEDMHRRLNILIYLNKKWDVAWGGAIELWDQQVKSCFHSMEPKLGRCVIFETSDRSFHGVSAVTCPETVARQSFAAYYYTKEAPEGWDGTKHSTIFKHRPEEWFRGKVQAPAERAQKFVKDRAEGLARRIKNLIG